MFTVEQRMKALETRRQRKQERDEERERLRQKLAELKAKPVVRTPPPPLVPSLPAPFDWSTAPLNEALTRLADLKREYDKAAAIINQRSSAPEQLWTCWTEQHKNDRLADGSYLIPASVRKQCLRHGKDGSQKFRDDGHFVTHDGVRMLEPVCCCNVLCYSVYQKYRLQQKLRTPL